MGIVNDLTARFEQNTQPEPNSGCLLWLGRVAKHNGYGQLSVSNREEQAHRVAYRMTKGEIPTGLMVLHSCDQPSCVNPDHLRLGTQQDNMADRAQRNRTARGMSNGKFKHGLSDTKAYKAEKSRESYHRMKGRA